ncbi:MAG: 1-acyl-sn-glycerol-3-phosphate acyltransferase [Patescibacteria group bacterium]
MAEISPNLYILQAFKNLHSLGDATVAVLEKSKRPHILQGAEHFPSTGGFIVAANHFVRVDDPTDMTGDQKMNDIYQAMGLITRAVREKCPDTTVVWTPSEVPRPEALWPKTATPRELLAWLEKDARFAGANILRKTFLSLVSNANDVLPVPHGTKGMRTFYKEAISSLRQKNVIALFPEGEVSVSMRQAKEGFAHLAFAAQVPVIPVSTYDQDGVLCAVLSSLMQPPQQRSDISAFADSVMQTIAQKLPLNLRGVYS